VTLQNADMLVVNLL